MPRSGRGDQVLQRAGIAGLEVDVRHPHDRLAREAVGAHAPGRAIEPDRGGGLAAERNPRSTPWRTIGTARPSTPLVVPAVRAESAGLVASAVTFISCDPYSSLPIASGAPS